MATILSRPQCVNTLKPKQDGYCFANDIFLKKNSSSYIITEVCSQVSNQQVIIGSGNGLSPAWQQATTWTSNPMYWLQGIACANDDPDHWHPYASPGSKELTAQTGCQISGSWGSAHPIFFNRFPLDIHLGIRVSPWKWGAKTSKHNMNPQNFLRTPNLWSFGNLLDSLPKILVWQPAQIILPYASQHSFQVV